MVKQRKIQQKSVGHLRCLAYPLARTTELVMFIDQAATHSTTKNVKKGAWHIVTCSDTCRRPCHDHKYIVACGGAHKPTCFPFNAPNELKVSRPCVFLTHLCCDIVPNSFLYAHTCFLFLIRLHACDFRN
jgi:hypothetical protein